MKYHRRAVWRALSVAAAVFAVSSLAACGSNSSPSTTTPASASPTAAASGPAGMVPDVIQQAGVLKIGTSAPSPPGEYFLPDNKTLTGSDVDLGNEIARILGLKVEWKNMNWDGLRPALASGRFDAIMSEMGDFTDRQAQVTFVDYMNGGICLLVRKADEGKFQKIEDLAGLTLGATKGASTVGVGKMVIDQLNAANLKPITLDQFPSEAEGTIAMRSGRIDGYIYDWMAGVYRVKTQPAFGLAFPNMLNQTFVYGVAVRKDADGQKLAEAVAAALDQMMADGSYQKIMEKYGMGQFLIEKATINGGTTSSGA